MSRRNSYEHSFVEFIPDNLENGIVYASIEYATVAHKCMCGCSNEVTSPLSPEQWQLTFNGRTISLSPSIGNWGFDCESHYWLEDGLVNWAGHWSKEKVAAGRERTKARLRADLDHTTANLPAEPSHLEVPTSWIQRLLKRHHR
jgi:hypothetical protein